MKAQSKKSKILLTSRFVTSHEICRSWTKILKRMLAIKKRVIGEMPVKRKKEQDSWMAKPGPAGSWVFRLSHSWNLKKT